MAYTIQKIVTSGHEGLRTRLHIKMFKDSDTMHRFLNKQTNNAWSISDFDFKTGVYAELGGEYHNVKSLDKSMLAHI